MNKIGIYYAYWTHDWDADFVPYVAKVKRLGFDILEVNSGTVTRMPNRERDRLRRAAEKAGIELTYWPGKRPFGEEKRLYLDRSVRSMREVMKVAEDCGVFFNVEVVNRFEQFLLNTAAEAVTYVRRVGSPHCRVLLDTFHLNIEEDSIRDAIVATGAWLGHFHVGETNRRPPGRGRMPWDEIFGALRRIGYTGAITMEPFLMPGGEVGRDISVYRNLGEGLDLDREAGRALKFVRRKLAR